jgi:hypothetical protein
MFGYGWDLSCAPRLFMSDRDGDRIWDLYDADDTTIDAIPGDSDGDTIPDANDAGPADQNYPRPNIYSWRQYFAPNATSAPEVGNGQYRIVTFTLNPVDWTTGFTASEKAGISPETTIYRYCGIGSGDAFFNTSSTSLKGARSGKSLTLTSNVFSYQPQSGVTEIYGPFSNPPTPLDGALLGANIANAYGVRYYTYTYYGAEDIKNYGRLKSISTYYSGTAYSIGFAYVDSKGSACDGLLATMTPSWGTVYEAYEYDPTTGALLSAKYMNKATPHTITSGYAYTYETPSNYPYSADYWYNLLTAQPLGSGGTPTGNPYQYTFEHSYGTQRDRVVSRTYGSSTDTIQYYHRGDSGYVPRTTTPNLSPSTYIYWANNLNGATQRWVSWDGFVAP